MNKIAKAAVAGAAGIILLMGGAGSLAYWNNQANLSSANQAITAGTLTATAVGNGTWTSSFNNGTATAGLVSKIVPGDTITFTQSFTINAVGDDLKYRIGVTTPAVGSSGLGAALTPTGSFTVTTSGGTTSAGSTTTTYTPTSGLSTITVTESFAWAWGTAPTSNTTGDNALQGTTYALPTTGVVTLTQVQS